jgi:hypothetical protein
MPRLAPKNIAPTTPPPPSGPAVSPPILRPEEFEEYPVFRETFLLLVTDARANAAVRGFGRLLHELVLEFWGYWPPHPEGLFAAELRSAVADLRHVQGTLSECTGPAFSLENPQEVRLARIGAEVAVELGKLTDHLEQALNSWREGEGS